jgi:hypothetical protein
VAEPFADGCPTAALEEGAVTKLNHNPAAKKATVPAGGDPAADLPLSRLRRGQADADDPVPGAVTLASGEVRRATVGPRTLGGEGRAAFLGDGKGGPHCEFFLHRPELREQLEREGV